jgi:diguanylate cyclase (GGDEF)-like protein/PAS domain S-box-containing protein
MNFKKNLWARQRTIIWSTLGFLATSVVAYFVVENAVQNTVELQALSVAEIVASQATTARSVYSQEIAGKLQRDGKGPDVNSDQMPGHVPIPSQFLKMLGRASAANSSDLFHYKPVSKWNLEASQGLSDDFLKWAWPQLEKQDQTLPQGPIAWKPAWRFEGESDSPAGKRVLRYLYADPASQVSCVACHNKYESKADIGARRVAGGAAPGKTWQQHQLMGALSITIPLDRIQTAAGTQIRTTSLYIFGLLMPVFLVVVGFNIRIARKDRELQATEKQLQSTEQEARNARIQLLANEDVQKAFTELSTYLQAIDQHALVSVVDPGGRIIRVNDKFCQISGYSQHEMADAERRMGDTHAHDAEFQAGLWDALRRGDIWKGEICCRAKSGALYWLDSAIVPLKDERSGIDRYISIQIDCTERKQAEQRINELAFFDPLTGLPNRTLLLDRLEQSMSAGSRSGKYSALLFIDVDNFKTLNDTLGHDMGDLLLKKVAQRLTDCVRAVDTVARMGGDEFVVMLTGLSSSESEAATQTERVGEKLLAVLNEIYQLKDVSYRSTSSIGATLFSGLQTEVDVLFKQADMAMYKAKDAGRNALRFFDPDMAIFVMKRVALEADLREAVQERQFTLHYQPQIANGRLTGAEALARWNHPRRGMVSPAEFIPLAEETGLIVPLGHWVLQTACSQLASWAARPEMAELTIAVNVSVHQFCQSDFVEQVLDVIRSTGANSQRLKLELTESVLVANVEDIIEKMFALKAEGVGFSLDDFGTGYSSLSYLKRLPLDQLKIDQSFVRDVLSDTNGSAIAKTIIALARSLGLGVIAEGVETAAQRDFLAGAGCDAYQGYFLSRPLAIEGFEGFCAEHAELVASV